jgi:hypothetical protein
MNDIISRNTIRYDLMAEAALRTIVRDVMLSAAERGLPGSHHFYITFATRYDGVEISDRLLSQHPDEMTIVIQHQYWGLNVTDDYFEIGLSFQKMPESLKIPFAAVKAFYDPSVRFALQFNVDPSHLSKAPPVESFAGESEASTEESRSSAAEESKPEESEGEVVSLDSFRKKK